MKYYSFTNTHLVGFFEKYGYKYIGPLKIDGVEYRNYRT